MARNIPVSVIIVTRNEGQRISACIRALQDFDEIIVVDSHSTDDTAALAIKEGAIVIPYAWDGAYPKKRQWCLDHVATKHARIFFVDADEVVTSALCEEIRTLDWARAGYFVRGRYVYEDAPLRFGLKNNKLCLFDRTRFAFPVVDDLNAEGMGEIEGHYQPLPTDKAARVGQLKAEILHYSGEGAPAWRARHEHYARWEAWMLKNRAYPPEIGWFRAVSKYLFRHLPFRPAMAFAHSYILKGGMFDGARGFRFARTRFDYYRMVNNALLISSTAPVPTRAAPTDKIAA